MYVIFTVKLVVPTHDFVYKTNSRLAQNNAVIEEEGRKRVILRYGRSKREIDPERVIVKRWAEE